MRIFLLACLLACDAAPEPACKCTATTCVCDGGTSPVCPSVAVSRGECTNEPRCMGCDGVAGFSCACTADDAGHHWFCIGTGYSCTNEP